MKLNVYFTWHNSYPEYNKNFIYSCIKEVCNKIENKDDLKSVFFDIINVEDSKGAENFNESFKERQKIADIQINDITVAFPFARFLRFLPGFKRISSVSINNNVMYEMRNENISDEQHIHIMNTHFGTSTMLPADIRNNTVTVKYDYSKRSRKNEDKIRQQLMKALSKEIKCAALVAIQRQDEKYKPFITWFTQSQSIRREKEFQITDELTKIQQTVRNHRKGLLRVIGLSGLGKTRVVFEAFGVTEELKRNYRYYNIYNNLTNLPTICESIKNANKNDEGFTFIIDNCDIDCLRVIKSLIHDYNLTCPVITIFNDPVEQPEKDVSYIYIENETVHDVIQKIVQEEHFNIEIRNQIEVLAGENTQMACLLIDAYKESGTLGNRLNDTELMDKLIGFGCNTEERKIMQSFSLFDFIGIEKPNEEQYQFIAKATCITSIVGDDSLKIQKVYETYRKKEKLFEKNGSLISVRPKPLAYYLAEEWFNVCSPERMTEMLSALENFEKHGSIMIESLAKQIQYLGYNKNAQKLIEKIMEEHGPFDFAEVLDSHAAMRLFRSFVQINPIAVAELLERIIMPLETNILREYEYTRRDLVWTVETICFDSRTFKKGSKIMLQLAVAENESYGNNATNQFLRLFSPVLSGTETDLNSRFSFLEENIEEPLYKNLVLKAVSRALSWNAVYWGGAEQQGLVKKHNYEPTKSELIDYSKNCVILLKKEIENNTEYCAEVKKTLSGSIREFVRQTILKDLLPLIEEIIHLVGSNWSEMRDSLKLLGHYDNAWLDRNTRVKIDELIVFLSPDSFVTRFENTADAYKYTERDKDYQEERKEFSEKFSVLAQEFSESSLFTDEVFNVIYTTKGLYIEEFGKELSKIDIKNEDAIAKFIDASVKVIKKEENTNSEILFYYVLGTGDFAFNYIINKYGADQRILKIIFRIAGAKNHSLSAYSWLFDYADKDEKNLTFFDDFTSYYDWYSKSENEIYFFLEKVCSYEQYGFSVLLSMLHKLFYFEQSGKLYGLAKKLVSLIKNECEKKINYSEKEKLYGLSVILLKKYNLPELACLINSVILNSLSETKRFDGNGYYKSLYDIMCEYYFGEIWTSLSSALLSEGESIYIYLNLEFALGTMIGSYTHDDILHIEKNRDYILSWCEKNPNIAPLRIIRIIPFFTEKNEPTHFVLDLVNTFGSNLKFLEAVHSKVNSYILKGSVIPYYEHQKDIWKQFMNLITDRNAKNWISSEIKKIDKTIAEAHRNELEEKMIYGC